MTAAHAAHNSLTALLVSDTVYFWVQVVMIVGIVLMLIASFFLARSNKRMGEETQRRREQRRAEADTAEANVDALAGRPEVPSDVTQDNHSDS